jgi:hypothetical protein
MSLTVALSITCDTLKLPTLLYSFMRANLCVLKHKVHKLNTQCAKKVRLSVEKFQLETNKTIYNSGLLQDFQSVLVKI